MLTLLNYFKNLGGPKNGYNIMYHIKSIVYWRSYVVVIIDTYTLSSIDIIVKDLYSLISIRIFCIHL